MSDKYEDSHPYKLGVKYAEIGKVLMNPKSTIKDMVELERKYGFKIDFVFSSPLDIYALAA